MPGKLAKIDQYPDLKDNLALLLAEGAKRQEIADAMGVRDRGTITEWAKRSDIQAKVSKIIRERSNRILSRVDTKIEKLLDSDKSIPPETLLKMRQAYAGSKVDIDIGSDKTAALQELMSALDENPDLASAFAAVVEQDADES